MSKSARYSKEITISRRNLTVKEGSQKQRASRNRTIELNSRDIENYQSTIVRKVDPSNCLNKIICGDSFEILKCLPAGMFDLLFADPPYNLTKVFAEKKFRQTTLASYEEWLDSWLKDCFPLLKPTASIYICGDWRSSAAIQRVGMRYFKLQNRITWEREKGRGAKRNWKNSAEDIWFFTVSDNYTFNLDEVKLKRKVIAPYTVNGQPKDWEKTEKGNFRVTHPSNIWTDLSVPFWSMPENTDHPTQKPEKLLAKIILANTNAGDVILDPFAGSGTTAVVAKKLERNFVAIEMEENFCLLAQKRLALAEKDKSIQGYADGIFLERNVSLKSN